MWFAAERGRSTTDSHKMADDKEHEDDKSTENTPETEENDEEMVNGDEDDSEFDDPEGFVDDISDEDLLGDILSQKPKLIEGTESIIVVDNVPVVGQDRCDKLKNVIRKVFSKFGKIMSEYYPMENGATKGFIFLEFSTPADATRAVKTANGYKLDKQHIFAVNHFVDFNNLKDPNTEWKAPTKQPYTKQENLRSWLLDPDCNDQYSVIHGDKTSILWNSPQEPMLVKERPNWTETYTLWSPKGTFLATFHGQGVALWGGEEFKRIMRFNHPGVQLLDFSPCERYLVSFSPLASNPEDPTGIIVWDIRTGLKKRGFHSGDTSQWPAFKWSHDGNFFGRMATDSISIYETPSFGLLDKKSLKVEGVKDFQWSPSDDYIAYWTPEDKDTPARVVIMQIPGRNEIRVKNLFNVSDCKMYWHNKGDYFAVKVDRYTKSKKALYYNFELFRIRERQIPVESVEMKEPIISFAWEPCGTKFCVIHGETPRITASFYNMENQGSVELQKTYEKRQANNIFWSPNGQYCVLAGLRSMNGILEFHDTADWVCMNQAEHFMATDVEWDPTGRFVATSVSWWAHKVDNGYFIWSFQGKLLQRHALDQFCQLLWRQRPKTLLTDADLKKLKKGLKQYQKQFEIKDRMSQSKASKEIIDRRRRKVKEFEGYRQKRVTEFQQQKKQRMELREGLETDNLEGISRDVDVETIEFFVKEEVIEIEE